MASVAYLFLAILSVASAAPESRIVGGSPVTIEEFPYVIAFTYLYPGPGITVQRCVGSLVSSWHGITTSFCFTGANLSNMKIRAGSTNSLSGGTVVSIANVIKHPDYTELPRSNDLAVVVFQTPLGISNVIDVLYLPPPNYYIEDNRAVKIVSWGFETETGPQLETLKTVILNKINTEECANAFGVGANVTITDKAICVKAPGKGLCTGDSGAPMAKDKILLGTFFFFQNCLTDEYPDAFTRIDRYTNWILEVAIPGGSRQAGIRNAPLVAL